MALHNDYFHYWTEFSARACMSHYWQPASNWQNQHVRIDYCFLPQPCRTEHIFLSWIHQILNSQLSPCQTSYDNYKKRESRKFCLGWAIYNLGWPIWYSVEILNGLSVSGLYRRLKRSEWSRKFFEFEFRHVIFIGWKEKIYRIGHQWCKYYSIFYCVITKCHFSLTDHPSVNWLNIASIRNCFYFIVLASQTFLVLSEELKLILVDHPASCCWNSQVMKTTSADVVGWWNWLKLTSKKT